MTKWKQLVQTMIVSVSFKLTLFVLVTIMMFIIGVMVGFIINHDNVLNAFSFKFWHRIIETIGGNN
ncbi:DNA-directed RNA polymerase subunit beta [Staphylococcus lutrae]|nr:DNA-directed RNA polymerase subunit beta [Staphylococcus lutrae]